ncbi:MAG: UvrD-helicase domain-containing protein, partial [Candidatus Omnitrophica bacterium]|nr:UvrD-helicase domain-containing protein [Candidatus Omnitrophota bacterium]
MTKKYLLKDSPSPSRNLSIDYAKELNSEQLRVVYEGDGPVLVLAGAGSGKTRTLVYRVAYLIEKGIRPENILLVTFTNKAAAEMMHRVEILLKERPHGLHAGTFHHIGNMTLRRYAKSLGYERDFAIFDEEDSRTLIKSCMDNLNITTSERRFPKSNVVNAIISYAANSRQKVADVIVSKYPYFLEAINEIERIAGLYQRRKKNSNSMDYDDLLIKWAELIKTDAQAREHYTTQFQYILVDEYQDTNKIQHEIVNALAVRHKNILVVGDDAQSIYSFRAAEIQNILDFPKVYPDCKTHKLEVNYRSTPEILHLANLSISNNRNQYPKNLKSIAKPFEKPALVHLRDERAQSSFIVQRILELKGEGLSLNQIAILFRARYHAAELELELLKRSIPYILRGGVRFFEQAHIKDVVSYLRIMQNVKDEVSWRRVLLMQRGIGKAAVDAILKSELKDIPKRAKGGWDNISRVLRKLKEPEFENRPDLQIEEIIKGGYDRYALNVFDDARDRLEDLEELIRFASLYKTLDAFLSDIALREDFRGEAKDADKKDTEHLVLSTIHQAKGLEWEAVFIIGVKEAQFPHPASFEDPPQLEEERRLFYVAITRAKKHLYITQPAIRYDRAYGEVVSKPSLFIR